MGTRAGAAAPDPRRWPALAVIVASTMMVVLDVSIVNIALPHAQADLGISDASRHWVVAAYALALGSLLLLGGRVADFVGRKRVFVIGLVGFALASAFGGIAQNAAMLFGGVQNRASRAPAGHLERGPCSRRAGGWLRGSAYCERRAVARRRGGRRV